MSFRPGQVVARRYHKRNVVTWVQAAVVVADDDDGLLLWQPCGAPLVLYRDAVGRSLKDAPIDELVGASHVHTTFQHYSALMLHPAGASYSVWWMFAGERFAGWYVNLEAPFERHSIGIDTTDHALDLEIDPQRRVSWKDEAEFVARIGHPGYWDAAEAATIRATADRVAALAAEGVYPFDGTHCDFRPDFTWGVPELPAGWDRAPASTS
ncbi:DUF402 domain-containing protein [Micromonospora soli]|uniref:DUF402 domain-containing protein n=1 Tax=Micromonospora sp. NBRC 110009 TaxID=3061627 RepID=UPI002671CE93|nr:DUF402 domain-containing protein [Micromonospora sp. NBRC 110009]WKT97251.1 DUF402 domain-containing protein [Micromonospora sp. NBRC 110009]